MRCRLILVMPLLLYLASPAPAGIIFNRKKKSQPTTPANHVPELIATLKNDGDENKRLSAIEELRQYDPAANPNIVPALVEALTADKKPAVRAEAAQSLGRLRPVSQEVGQALEQALHNDASMRVRLQARSALMQYHWSGYHGTSPTPAADTAKQPPTDPGAPPLPPVINTAAKPPARLMPQPVNLPPGRFPAPPAPVRTTQEPPLAPPAPENRSEEKPVARPAGAQRLPQGPPSSPSGDGPSLDPPPPV